jgi:uncharacterized protein YqjF (DUF2071 family)
MMSESKVFLTAEWRNLLMLNYAVNPALLQPSVPAGTELDSFEGQTYVSLIGFEFNRTRVAGLFIPLHRSFEEVNLRFYVKRDNRRGVVFLRELVPRFAVAAIARLFFGENYQSVSMQHRIESSADDGFVGATYSWDTGRNRCSMQAEAEAAPFLPPEGSLAQFITEHYWGYAAQRDGSCLEYEVQHPRWLARNARCSAFSGDATKFYGAEFAKILIRPPDSAFLAEGSTVTVFKGSRIDGAAGA